MRFPNCIRRRIGRYPFDGSVVGIRSRIARKIDYLRVLLDLGVYGSGLFVRPVEPYV